MQGDAFLARVFDNEDDFERLDFTLREVASSAPWVREAAAQNEAKRRGNQANTVLQRMQVSETLPQHLPDIITRCTQVKGALGRHRYAVHASGGAFAIQPSKGFKGHPVRV